ncbi:WD repeat-containing protein 74-like [Zophobas morio]|uniref:WD repeat-containing protein 74-like n=1 Tax=Zophobas morio TaxID=2755281 RepID=UPI003082ED73
MKVFTGDSIGLLKGICLEKKRVVSTWRNLNRQKAIEKLSWGNVNEQKEILVATSDKTVEIIDVEDGNVVSTLKDYTHNGNFISIEGIESYIVTASSDGVIRYVNYAPDESKETCKKNFNASVSCVHTSPANKSIIAIGGREFDLHLYDLTSDKPLFKAKNISNDSVDLRCPVWVNRLIFLNDSGYHVAVGTGYHEIRRYDTRAQRKPVQRVNFGDLPITAISKLSEDKIIAGNSGGYMRTVEFRSKSKVLLTTRFRGSLGSIRAIAKHPELPYVVSAGLDRHLSLYSQANGRPLERIYLKQRLNDILFSSEGRLLVESNGGPEELLQKTFEEEEREELWNSMEKLVDAAQA